MTHAAMFLLAGALGGCGAPEDDTARAETHYVEGQPPPTWTNFAGTFFVTRCGACHAAEAPDRFGAPAAMVFDTREQVRALEGAVRASTLEARTMPLGGGVPEEDLARLEAWLDGGMR